MVYTTIMLQAGCVSKSAAEAFRFHILADPESLDPIESTLANSSYVADALYLPLLKYQNETLLPAGALKCEFHTVRDVRCELNPQLKFSNGESIEAQHYILSFRKIFASSSPVSEFFISLKNAKTILSRKADASELGMHALTSHRLQFLLEEEDSDFLFRLIQPATSARPTSGVLDGSLTTGPYFVDKFLSGRRLILSGNRYFPGSKDRPAVEILIVGNDETARNLFDSGQLNLLRRVTFEQIPIYKKKQGFFQQPLLRADYLGFNVEKVQLDVRRALSESPNYKELQKLMDARGTPGCPTLPSSYFFKKPCLPPQDKPTKLHTSGPWELSYSQQAGDDIEKAMQWFQHQWKKNTGVVVHLKSYEQGMYSHLLKSGSLALFRRGFSLNRPTCRALLESFTSGHPNNFTQYKSKAFDKLVLQMSKEVDAQKLKFHCQEGFTLLFKDAVIIPLGEIHFSMIHDSQYEGFKLNELNQIDLIALKIKTK